MPFSEKRLQTGDNRHAIQIRRRHASRRIAAVILPADHGTHERWQHSGRIYEPTGRAGQLAARATEEHVIDILLLKHQIGKRHAEAGLRLKLDYQRAGLEARVSARYSPVSSARDFFANIRERTDYEEAAYQRWRNALRAVGLLCSDIVVSTACHGVTPEPAMLKRLRQGLKKLADWYGMPDETATPARPQTKSGQYVQQTAAR